MSRLKEALFSKEGHVHFEVRGDMTKKNEPLLHLEIDGCLELTCQRCLEALTYPLKLRRGLLLVPPGEAWPEEELQEDDYDAIACEPELDAWSLVEEEILLALPPIPRHENCALPTCAGEPAKIMSFDALAGLRVGRKVSK